MVLIFSQNITPRLQYITKFMFTGILQVPCKVTSNTEEYEAHTGPRINYSFQNIDGIPIIPKSLLFKNDISAIEVDVVWLEGMPLLFHQCGDVPLPFDPFAAAFYMISRYEEYIVKETDQHSRFLSKWSIAGKNNFINIPVVDHWALLLQGVIEKEYPSYIFPNREYRFIPTVDVDSVAAFKGKPLFRTIGGTLRSLLSSNYGDLKERTRTLILGKPDPFDTFDKFHQWHSEINADPVWFFLVGDYSKQDGNLSSSHPITQKIIKEIAHHFKTGIHPSYYSHLNQEKLQKEINTIKNITHKEITCSRQHFLRMTMPETYQMLIKSGIKEDYTMGFSDTSGFRAGTCTPFPFYDLTNETETGLILYPLVIMDMSFLRYMKVTPEQALEISENLINEIKKVKGTLITLAHNSFIYDSKYQKGWESFYPKLLQLAKD